LPAASRGIRSAFPKASTRRVQGFLGRATLSRAGAACARASAKRWRWRWSPTEWRRTSSIRSTSSAGFKSLDRIKPHVKKWIETTPETITLLTANEIDFSYTYLSRVLPAQKAGSSVQMSMQQTINSLEYLAVPKFSKNKEAAMRYLAFCLRPDRQAAFGSTNNFMPNARKGAAMLPPDSAKGMPDMRNPNNIVLNDAWWADTYDSPAKALYRVDAALTRVGFG
jgi:spermidine/putrescine-binding protein